MPLRLLVVVADDDPAGRSVAQRLVTEAAGDGLNGGHGKAHTNGGGTNGNGHSAADSTLRLAEVTADRPDVPEDSVVSGVLVVVSAGSRTAWELTGLTEACQDAGHRVVGVVVARPTRPRTDEPAEQPEPAKDEELAGAS